MKLPRPLIFDLDDTLIQSFQTYVRLHQRVAEELGLRVPTTEALIPYLATWEETLLALWPGTDLTAFIERYDRLADDHPYPAVPGTVPALERLRAAGHSLWIVTKRSRRRLADRMQQAEIPRGLFNGIYAFEDQPAVKPDPRCFQPVWQALGGYTADALYVGDRSEDLQAARDAGIGFVAVLTGPEVAFGFPGPHPPEATLASVADLPERATLLERSR